MEEEERLWHDWCQEQWEEAAKEVAAGDPVANKCKVVRFISESAGRGRKRKQGG